jgi:hypothetical protein
VVEGRETHTCMRGTSTHNFSHTDTSIVAKTLRAWLQWAGSLELRRSARVASQLLQHAGGRGEAAQALHHSLLAAARAALAVNPETTAIIADALQVAEADTAGRTPLTTFAQSGFVYNAAPWMKGSQHRASGF